MGKRVPSYQNKKMASEIQTQPYKKVLKIKKSESQALFSETLDQELQKLTIEII